MGSTSIDMTHLQTLAAAGELTKDPALLAEVETLLGRVLAGGTAIALNRYDFYPTPQVIVKLALNSLAKTDYEPETILEPSCGTGAWLDEIKSRWPGAVIHVVEKNPLNRLALKEQGGIELVGDDFLTYEPKHGYDLIVGNPPFGEDGDKLTWAKHIERAKGMLTARGQMMMITPAGITFRTEKQIEAMRAEFKVRSLPDKAFKDSGTTANTAIAWYSPDKGLEPRFQGTTETPSHAETKPAAPIDLQALADSVIRSMRYNDRIIDTALADMERYQTKGAAGLLLEWNAQQGKYEGWANQETWMVNVLVTQNRMAYETMQRVVPTLKGMRARRAASLHQMWASFCAATQITLKYQAAFNENELDRKVIDWAELLDEWEQAMDAVTEKAAEQAADRRDVFGMDLAVTGTDKSMAIILPEGTVSEIVSNKGEGYDLDGLPIVD